MIVIADESLRGKDSGRKIKTVIAATWRNPFMTSNVGRDSSIAWRN